MDSHLTPHQVAQLLDAAEMYPDNFDIQVQAIGLIRSFVPTWHFPMLVDEVRASFYKKMIDKHVAGKTVLEIGAGTGFLALMAAKAGAKHVYACEQNPVMLSLAQKFIDASPFANCITLLPCHSTKLRIGHEIPQKVDIVLSEILANDVFSELMIPTLRDARRLLKRGGLFLPPKVEVTVCLVECQDEDIEFLSDNPFAESVGSLLRRIPLTTALDKKGYRRLSATKAIATITHGSKLDVKLPISFTLTANALSLRPFVCVSFRCIDGRNDMSSFPSTDLARDLEKWSKSWNQFVWPLSPQKKYFLRLHLHDEQYVIITDATSDGPKTASKIRRRSITSSGSRKRLF